MVIKTPGSVSGSGFNGSGSTTQLLTIKSSGYQPVPNSLFTFRRVFFQKAEDLKGILVSVYKIKATPYQNERESSMEVKLAEKEKTGSDQANL